MTDLKAENQKDHEAILERVNHNCDLNQKRFDGIESKIDQLVSKSESRQYKTLFWVITSGIAIVIGLLIDHILT